MLSHRICVGKPDEEKEREFTEIITIPSNEVHKHRALGFVVLTDEETAEYKASKVAKAESGSKKTSKKTSKKAADKKNSGKKTSKKTSKKAASNSDE